DSLQQALLRQHAGSLLRKVVQDAGEVLLAVGLERADRQVNGKNGSVPAARHDLAADADDLALAGLQMMAKVAVMAAVKRLGHQDIDVATDQLVAGETEHVLDGRVERADQSQLIDDDYGADGRLQRGLQHLRAE